MTSITGLELLRSAMGPLAGIGFEVVREKQLDAFGDAYIELRRQNTFLRLVRDRGQYRVDIRASEDHDAWHLAEVVLVLAGISAIDHVLDDAELAWTIQAVADNYDEIERLFSPTAYRTTKSRLAAREEERDKSMRNDAS